MKRSGILLLLLIGTVATAFSQKKSERKPNMGLDTPLYGNEFLQADLLKLKTPQSLYIDSVHTFVPRSLYTERQLTVPSGTNQRPGLPFVELPDPQSRMPIKEFGDSVNYTILKKEY